MSLASLASITGAAQTGFTTPGYTLSADLAPDANSRQYVVSSVSGTQPDVRTNTAGDPFTVTIRRQPYKALPSTNGNGTYGNIPMNRLEILGRKGTEIDSAGTVKASNCRFIAETAAGAEKNDPNNLLALYSLMIGILQTEAANIGAAVKTGVV